MFMEEDKKRIGIGNSKFPALNEEVKKTPEPDYTFSSTQITFDNTQVTFDNDNTE